MLATLRSRGEPAEGIESLGDSFMLQSYYPGKSYFEISKLFGGGFADSVAALTPREWHGPVLSGYGVHLVYVHQHERGAMPELDTVKEQVQRDWLDERRRELQDEYVSNVVSSYEVVFEGAEPGENRVESQRESTE
jgi:hypothetical protein